MSEHIRPEWLQLPIEDVEAELCINGIREVFSTSDSAYWLYPEQFAMFNNVVKWQDDGYQRIFGATQEDFDTLHEAGVTQISAPYPNAETIAGWWAVEMAHFDDEMTYLQRVGELPE